jgi:molybdate transport system regulatory protein
VTGGDHDAAPRRRALKIKIQIFCGEEIAMGPGKADLLDAIRAHGSISAAGRAMGMSYRRAWLLVDAMNRCWRDRLVDTTPGGGRERGAQVTPAGEAILSAYRAMQAAAGDSAARHMTGPLESLLRPAPLSDAPES